MEQSVNMKIERSSKKILIDADGCPVVKITLKLAKKYGIECIILCDTAHEFNDIGEGKVIIVSKGADSVDFKLVNIASAGDIAVTQDYGLAAMCLARGVCAINQNGMMYTDGNIDMLLNERYISKKARSNGIRLKGQGKRTPAQDNAFAEALEKLLNK